MASNAKDTSKLKPEWTAASGDLLAFLRTPFSSPYPVGKAVDFETIFSNKLGQDAIGLLKTATEQRKKLMEVLSDTKTDSRNVIAAVDAYLPSLWRITASMQASEANVHLVKKIDFKWTSMLNKKGKEFSGDVFLFETSFVLTIRAILHRDAAKIIQEQNTGDLQEMAKELRMGAGIFQFVGNELLTRWQSPPDHRAPEAVPLVHHCLAALYLADAQRLAIVKALASETSPTTLAKLFIGCAEKYEFAARNLQNVDKEVFDSMVPGVLEELGAWPAILRGCASNCLAQSAWARGEFGKGLGYAIDGTQRLQMITMGKSLQATSLQESLSKAISRALALELEYQNDCNNVYFEKVSKDIRMVDGAFVVNPIVYELPLAELVNFADGPMPAAQQKMKIQNFWTALWAKPESYPQKDEHVAPGNAVAGATELPGVMEAKALASLSITGGNTIAVPEGVDASVFSSLPTDIQREIAADASRASGRVAF